MLAEPRGTQRRSVLCSHCWLRCSRSWQLQGSGAAIPTLPTQPSHGAVTCKDPQRTLPLRHGAIKLFPER